MKLVFLSDTHGLHDRVFIPEGDTLIFSGDLCGKSKISDVEKFASFLKNLPHRYKIVVAGNHDFPFEGPMYALCEEIIRNAGAYYLNDSFVTIEKIKFYGSPISPRFLDWAFNRSRGEDIKKHWDIIPSDTDVLITHGPPYGILDLTENGEHVGCLDLLHAVERINPKIHVFGHIHEAYGILQNNETKFINASILNARYNPVNSPIVVDLERNF